ncbi:hypothetical protein Q1695_000466 [Nippostrongylus brasiliensis]|nr:hypothetical protein Q1695_000466 [Nippostrongylus brasiliensis]
MALIYANAVNKRMNNPPQKPKKKQTPPCLFLDDTPTSTSKDLRKRSSSRETMPLRKTSCNVPLHLQATPTNISSNSAISPYVSHRPVHRSKTSCGNLSCEDGNFDKIRKISQPAISHSATNPTLCNPILSTKRTEEKRALSKKSLIQKYNLEHGYDDRLCSSEQRRKSVSLDADQWSDLIQGQMEKSKKYGAFQKMKTKFSKWKLSNRTE